jgi:hypothetical protein
MAELNLPSTITGETDSPIEGLTDFIGEAAETVNSVDEALGVLNRSLTSQGSIQFPSNLGNRSVQFQIKTRVKNKQRGTAGFSLGSLISLPIPANLSTGYNAQYGQEGLGVLGNQAMSMTERGIGTAQAIAELKDNGINLINEQAKAIAASASQEVAGVLGAAIGKTVGTNVGVGLATAGLAGIGVGALRGAGLAVNPHLAVLFEGMNFRNHTFNYKFAPRDEGESNSLRTIIKEFKNAMHPVADNGAFFEYPDEFLIKFPQDQFLFKIGSSVLTSFSIDYTPDGGSYFHNNGAPVSVALSLQFTELDILTKKEIGDDR